VPLKERKESEKGERKKERIGSKNFRVLREE
jgi:hypothetical protein